MPLQTISLLEVNSMIRCFFILIVVATLSCNNSKYTGDRAKQPQKAEETETKPKAIADAQTFSISDLETPESFQYDSESEKYFISNIVGAPDAKDGNGYISRLSKDGKMDIKQFIVGLNAPKGITFLKSALYVTDIDTVKGYDPRTGKELFSQDLSSYGARFLNDIVAYKDFLYVSDTKADTIFKLIPSEKKVEVFCSKIIKPNGLAINLARDTLTVVSWGKQDILELAHNGQIVHKIPVNLEHLDGAVYDKAGNLYVSHFTQGIIYKIATDGNVSKVAEGLTTPADISLGAGDTIFLVPSFEGNRAFSLLLK
jgi:sugar lactone lactonase YvrE